MVDIGLLAEALLYYDSVLANVNTQPQFAQLLRWFIDQHRFADLLGLIRDGVIQLYEFSFASSAGYDTRTGTYVLVNIQDELQAKPDSFMERFVDHSAVKAVLPDQHHLDQLRKALDGKVIEAKADDFGNPIENARVDYRDPRRNAVVVQAFVDDLYKLREKGRAPEIRARVEETVPNKRHLLHFNIAFSELTELAGPELNFHMGTPLVAGAVSNRLI